MTKRRGHISLTLATLAMLAAEGYEITRPVPVCREPRPEGYGRHLPKSARRGKSWQQQQAMRRHDGGARP